MFIQRKTMFDLIREADEDNTSDTAQNDTEQTADEAPAPGDTGEDATADDIDTSDNFDINADLEDSDPMGGIDVGGDNNNSDTDSTPSTSSSGSDEEEEPVEANTDMFSSLSEDEQKRKIVELKSMYAELYSSLNDLSERIKNIDSDIIDITMYDRINSMIYSLQRFIAEYMKSSFPNRSYLENDIAFNHFLSILNSIKHVLIDISKSKEKITETDKK